MKVEADGSTIKAYLNGTEQVSTVDTAITGNLRTGITLFKGVGETARGNGFEAADLSPAGGYAHSRVVIVG